MNETDLEEIHAPGHVPRWVKPGQEVWWGISREAEKSMGLASIHQYRPRYAQALALLRRATGTHLHNNLPQYNKHVGWMNYSTVLGKEEEWDEEDLPSETECMTAYMVQFQIHLSSGFGVSGMFAATRLGSYAYAETKDDLLDMKRQWEDLSYRTPNTLAFPFSIETNALLATCSLLRFGDLRRFLGLTFATTSGPLVFQTGDTSVFPKW